MSSDDVVEYVAWPNDLQQAISSGLTETSKGGGGSGQLVSSDGCAMVELARHGQTLTTQYLARLPQEGAGSGGEGERAVKGDVSQETETVEDRMDTLGLTEMKKVCTCYVQ